MKIKTEKRCGCRGDDGKQLGARCPKLARKNHGKWSYRLRVPKELVPLVGQAFIRDSGFLTAKAAEDAGNERIAAVRAGQRSAGALTVGTYLDQWLDGKRKLRPTTLRSYESHIRLHLKPYLGQLALTGLHPNHIDQAYRQIERTNVDKRQPTGPATIGRIHATLRTALNGAVKQRLLQYNPALSVELPEHSERDVEPWEAEEVGRFLDEAASDRLSVMYELIALHGLRRGEACGCQWPGLDVTASVLTISLQITDNGGRLGVWPPKTRSGKRKVDLDAGTLGSLLAHGLRQDAEREAMGAAWENGTLSDQHGRPVVLSGLMFTRPDGRHLDPAFVSRHMQVIARRVGLCAAVVSAAPAGTAVVTVGRRHVAPERTWTVYRDREPIGTVTVTRCVRRRGSGATLTLAEPLPFDLRPKDELGERVLSRRRLHDLRHSSASIQLDAGVDLALISKRHGHSSTAITSDLYVHLLRSAGQRAAEAVASAIPRAGRVPTLCPQPANEESAGLSES